MRIFIIFTVYLLIRVVSPYGYSGVLFMRLNGGEKSGVDYIPHWIILAEYYGTNDCDKI